MSSQNKCFPFFHSWLADLPRLCPDLATASIIISIASRTFSCTQDSTLPAVALPPQKTHKTELASECHISLAAVERTLSYLVSSGMAEIEDHGDGTVTARLLYCDWPSLPDCKKGEL